MYDRAFRAGEITDGLSTTIFVSEDSGSVDGQWINGRNLFDQAYPIGRAPAFENDMRSEHRGGVNALFGDGAARFVRESIARAALAAVCTRAGDEPVAADDL